MVRFWKPEGPYASFSNYFVRPVVVGGLEWKSSEAAYQAQKFMSNYPGYAYTIFCARTPHMAKYLATMRMEERYAWQENLNTEIHMAQSIGVTKRPDWDTVKDQVMYEIVLAKFQQHDDLRATLLATGDEIIAETSPYDNYWGLGSDGTGQNKLGRILMQVRSLLKK